MQIKSVTDLSKYYDVLSHVGIARAIYEGTDCGAYIKFTSDGITIGSIVEGIDATAEEQVLSYPFTSEELEDAISAVEDDAERLWNETHGCQSCWTGQEWGEAITDLDFFPVNPDCEFCRGEGIAR